ncbi:MAG: recombinase family protein [Acidobacteria bacterium]|nr:recombinase family protein [Acidobacteriota bacterium]
MSIPAAIYARVSSDRQREQETISSQTEALQAYAAEHGYGVPAEWVFEDDGYSGTTLVRPEHLLVQVQGMIAEYERAQIAERTRRGKRHKARRGCVNVLSAAPYGYRYVKKTDQADAYYHVDEAEAALVRQVFAAYTREGLSMYAIARRFNATQVPTRTGGRWDPATIRKMLLNPAYIGKAGCGRRAPSTRQRITRRLRQRGRLPVRDQARRDRPREEWVAIPVPALISEETFALAQAQLEHNTRFARRRTKRPTLLQGLLVCAQCGYAVYRKRRMYQCGGRDGWAHANGPVCTARPVRQDHLDTRVWREVIRLLEDPTLVEAELARRREAARQADPTRQRVDELTRQHTRAANATDRLVTAYQQALITIEELQARMPALRTQQHAIAAELHGIEMAAVDQARYLRLSETLTDFGTRLRARAETLDIREQQKIVRWLIREIRIGADAITICHSLPIGPPEPERDGPGGSAPADGVTSGGSPQWLLHVHGQGAGLRPGEGAGRRPPPSWSSPRRRP